MNTQAYITCVPKKLWYVWGNPNSFQTTFLFTKRPDVMDSKPQYCVLKWSYHSKMSQPIALLRRLSIFEWSSNHKSILVVWGLRRTLRWHVLPAKAYMHQGCTSWTFSSTQLQMTPHIGESGFHVLSYVRWFWQLRHGKYIIEGTCMWYL